MVLAFHRHGYAAKHGRYSGAHAAFHCGGTHWKAWHEALRDMLIEHMIAEGPLAGSWDPVGNDCRDGGRVYATAMAVMSFDFYYRNFPTAR